MGKRLVEGYPVTVPGSGSAKYELKNTGGAYSCSCPAWRNQSKDIHFRTCKHLRRYVGDTAEELRINGQEVPDALFENPFDAVELAPLPKSSYVYAATPPAKDLHPVVPDTMVFGLLGKTPPKETNDKPFMLALQTPWDGVQDLKGWMMSEKRDGVRTWWDGIGRFWSRLGNEQHAPDSLKKGLPPYPLDGEFYLGRGLFHDCNGIVKRHNWGEDGKQIKLHVFDCPDEMESPFMRRFVQAAMAVAQAANPAIILEPHYEIENNAQVKALLEAMVKEQAEGLMARRRNSKYVPGRSNDLIKIIARLRTEARVTGYNAGKDSFKGMVGSFKCVLQNGKTFNCGTGLSHKDRKDPPKVGSIITVEFKTYTKDGTPREPSFVGVRYDVKW